jgi:sulfate adenylyltransferase subunit 1 (EFTu-like GTPase family)
MAMLGIRHVAVLVNKMDLAIRSGALRAHRSRVPRVSGEVGVRPAAVIPVAGREATTSRPGQRARLVHGPTVLDTLDAFPALTPTPISRSACPCRTCTSSRPAVTTAGSSRDRRVGAATSAMKWSSIRRAKVGARVVRRLQSAAGLVGRCGRGRGFTLREQIYVARGESRGARRPAAAGTELALKVSLFWLGRPAVAAEERVPPQDRHGARPPCAWRRSIA